MTMVARALCIVLVLVGVVAAQTGCVKGVIKWEGKTPKNALIQMDSDPVCKAAGEGKEMRKETTLVDANGNLGNVVLYISKGLPEGQKWPVKTETIMLNQKGCTYFPHIVAMQLGQKVEMRNSDKTTHNVHFQSKLNGDWNLTQSSEGVVPAAQEMKRAEIGTSSFKCDIHAWMESRVAIFEHPFFAVSAADGTFKIDNLPPGTYTLSAWHEKEKSKEIEVTVAAGAAADANFSFGKK